VIARIDNHLTWPLHRADEAVDAAARAVGHAGRLRTSDGESAGSNGQDIISLGRTIEQAAGRLGLGVEETLAPYPSVDRLVRDAGPAIFRLADREGACLLVVVKGNARTLTVVTPDLSVRLVDADRVRAALCGVAEGVHIGEIDELLDSAEVPRRRRQKAREALVRDRLSDAYVGPCWMLRPQPGGSFFRQLGQVRAKRFLALMLSAHLLQHLFVVGSWWLLGRAALLGRIDAGWLIAWALMLVTMIPIRLLATWCQGKLSFGIGALLRQRLLVGALRIDPQETRRLGAGHLLGRVMESDAIEALALNGGFTGLLAVNELVVALLVLLAGPAPGWHGGLILTWLVLCAVATWLFFTRRLRWTDARVGLTHEIVERMVGHRTRIAQEHPDHWHDGEDETLDHYHHLSRWMDRLAVAYQAGLVRGWFVLGIAGLLPALTAGQTSGASMAVGIGGVLLGARAFERLSGSLSYLIDAAICWRQIGPVFRAAAGDREEVGEVDAPPSSQATDQPVIEAHDVTFGYRGDCDAVLDHCSLSIYPGERILLEGPSGGGKSTLATILCGLRSPESGLVLLRGFDRHTLGQRGWSSAVAFAPQFHENHVLGGTLAFNLLLGRSWPPEGDSLKEAEVICRELGLDAVLSRMPAGLNQIVGETGWQLSHGEKSRIYIARTLLQGAEVVILDESFAALDPRTLQQCIQCVLRRARTLLVIAHP